MALVLPAYCTRAEVRRALDVKSAAWNNAQVDRAIDAARDSVEGLCHRRFYPEDTTHSWDWPNYQRAYPWRIWFDRAELADITVNPPVVTTGGQLIPDSAIFFGNPRYAPPYTYLELDRSQSYSFGSGTGTPQRNVAIQGTYGYWLKTSPAGTLTASVLAGDTTIPVSSGGLIGVGDLVIAGTERMIVTDAAYADTSISFTGLTTASMADNILAVPDGTKFSQGEVIQLDTEWCLVVNIYGNNLQLKRAWDGSILAEHTSGTIWAQRQLSVLRGALGTTAASHAQNAALAISVVPALVKQLSVAEAVVSVTQEPSAYAGQSGASPDQAGQQVGPAPGQGIPDLRDRCYRAHGRKVRQRVV
jgi:hypothetical protein